MAYTTSQLDAIITSLESSLGKGYAELSMDGGRLVYRNVDEILKAIAYFKNLRVQAVATAANVTPRRQILLSSLKGL